MLEHLQDTCLIYIGYTTKPDTSGFDEVIISPLRIKGLNRAKGHITTDMER